MRLSHNMFSLNIFNHYKRTLSENSHALGDISSGKKLNSAKDNPYKIAESETLKMQILCNETAQSNIQDTNSMLQTFDGALQQVNDNLSRLKEIVVKAANGTYNDEDKQIIQTEIDGIKKGISDLVDKTDFNGVNLSDSAGTLTSPTLRHSQIGTLPDEKIDIPFFNVSTAGLGIANIDVTLPSNDPNGVNAALSKVDNATSMVVSIRSKYGAIQSRLEDGISSIDETNQTYSSAQSGLEDADIAGEMVDYSRSQILIQSSLALMVQSNKLPQDALNILSRVK